MSAQLRSVDYRNFAVYAGRRSDEGDRSSVKDQSEETTDAGVTADMTTPYIPPNGKDEFLTSPDDDCFRLFATIWRFGVAVTTLFVSTKLLYVEPG